jgi:hypothetical protein
MGWMMALCPYVMALSTYDRQRYIKMTRRYALYRRKSRNLRLSSAERGAWFKRSVFTLARMADLLGLCEHVTKPNGDECLVIRRETIARVLNDHPIRRLQ